jgi:hypothetical protein
LHVTKARPRPETHCLLHSQDTQSFFFIACMNRSSSV